VVYCYVQIKVEVEVVVVVVHEHLLCQTLREKLWSYVLLVLMQEVKL
jgi:hypothetical protein